MGPVAESLSHVPPAEVRAIAVYIAAQMGTPATPVRPAAIDEPARAARAFPAGATLFAGACAGCHQTGAPMLGQGRPAVGFASSLRDEDPTSAAQAVLQGVAPPVSGRGPLMPALAASLTDAQIADVLSYARSRFTDRPPWQKPSKAVHTARKAEPQP